MRAAGTSAASSDCARGNPISRSSMAKPRCASEPASKVPVVNHRPELTALESDSGRPASAAGPPQDAPKPTYDACGPELTLGVTYRPASNDLANGYQRAERRPRGGMGPPIIRN